MSEEIEETEEITSENFSADVVDNSGSVEVVEETTTGAPEAPGAPEATPEV